MVEEALMRRVASYRNFMVNKYIGKFKSKLLPLTFTIYMI